MRGAIYHLKRIPNGKWQCPKCCQKNDQLKPIVGNLDPISKRARSKLITIKSQSGVKSGTEKVSQIFGGSIHAKKRSSSKGKSVLTLGVKPLEVKPLDSEQSDPSPNNPVEENLSSMNIDEEKKVDISPVESPCGRKSLSTDGKLSPPPEGESPPADREMHNPDGVPSNSEVAKSESNDKASVEKQDPSRANGSKGVRFILAIGATADKNKKRKQEVNNDDNQMKHQTNNKRKRSNSASKKRRFKTKSISLGSSKPQEKRKSINNGVSASLSEGNDGKSRESRRKSQVSF